MFCIIILHYIKTLGKYHHIPQSVRNAVSECQNHDDKQIPQSVRNGPNHEEAAIRSSDNATQYLPRQQIPFYFIQHRHIHLAIFFNH